MPLIKPALQGEALLADIAAAHQRPEHLYLWWLGQSGFLVQWQGHHLLFDPYLSDSLTEKYAHTDKPHMRMTERALAPDKLNFIELATSTHNHTDHLDGETLLPLMAANPAMRLLVPEANRAFAAQRLGCDPSWLLGMDEGTRVEVSGFSCKAIAAAHETLETDAQGRHKYLGYIVRCGPWTLYHSGDTVEYRGLVDKLKAQAVDIALLPINGRAPQRRVAGNLTGTEAAQLAQRIGARLVVPCHYEMFEFNTASPAAFVAECRRLAQPHRVLRCGERWCSGELAA